MRDIRAYQESDYPSLCAWWRETKVVPIPKDWLSTTGIMIPNAGAIFLYGTNSKLAFMENLVLNPELSVRNRRDIVQQLIKTIEDVARTAGYQMLISTVLRPSLLRQLIKKNFEIDSLSICKVFKRL